MSWQEILRDFDALESGPQHEYTPRPTIAPVHWRDVLDECKKYVSVSDALSEDALRKALAEHLATTVMRGAEASVGGVFAWHELGAPKRLAISVDLPRIMVEVWT